MVNNPRAPSFQPSPIEPDVALDALARWQSAATEVAAEALLGGVDALGIIVPHADDETLGCGGLIAEAADRGIAISVTVLTDGSASHPGSRNWPPRRLAAERRAEVIEAVARLSGGRGQVLFGNAPDGSLAGHRNLAAAIPPASLYVTCWRDDPHPDHQAAFAIAKGVAAKRAVGLLAFPLWTLTTELPVPQLPIMKLDISASLQRKRHALAAHRSQLGTLVEDVRGFVLDDRLCQLFVRPDELFVQVA